MILDFENMEVQDMVNFKGGEGTLHAAVSFDGLNRIMKGVVPPHASIGEHTHTDSSEILYVLSGSGKGITDGKEERVKAGQCLYCPKGHTHTFINDTDEDVVFFTVVPQQ